MTRVIWSLILWQASPPLSPVTPTPSSPSFAALISTARLLGIPVWAFVLLLLLFVGITLVTWRVICLQLKLRLHARGRLIHFDSNGEPDADSQEQRSFLARAFGTISAVLADFTKSPELIGDHDMTKGYLACIRNGIQSGALAAGKTLPGDW